MTRFRTTLIAATLAAAAIIPAQAAQTLNAGKSQIGFTFKQMNTPADGSFKRFAANVDFDPAKPEATKAEFSVDLTSIDTGSPDGDSEAKKKAWFNTAATPKATFTAKSVKSLGNGKFEARGPLTIKGVSRDVVSTFTAKQNGADLQLDGSFPLLRLQYKLGDGDWADTGAVADEVLVKYRFVLNGKAGK
ncbi:YceI family protein [Jeongeupia wiesaeckerbachi]|uniref:YceI family protein n=1 Tax=Jeongeupia wiesaeckerbachi TaxID=3051218 RepID=UPI003D8033E2